jgi:3-hydroxyacyl-[acyl-carrier-protein] dehydratase
VSDFPKPIDILPHRDPFLLVTEITALQPGVSVSARWMVTGDEGFFAGHFPGRPTVPGVLMVESLAQVGAIGVLTDERFAGKLPLLAGVDNARFRRQAVPGDTLELHVELGRLSGRAGKGSGKVLINGQLACQADLLFVLADV